MGFREWLAAKIAPPAAPKASGTRTQFAGAQFNRLTSDWLTTTQSPDLEAKNELRALVNRSRDLYRNNATAQRYVAMLDENVIGHRGIRLQGRIQKRDGSFHDDNDALEDAWEDFATDPDACVDGRTTFRDVEHLWARVQPIDGEFLLRLIPGFNNRWGFAFQVLPTDLLDPLYNRSDIGGQNAIRMSVEVDKWQKPVAYHLLSRQPTDLSYLGVSLYRDRVPADQIVHLFRPIRPMQSRGIPWFHPVLMSFRMLQGYTEAELMAARVSAAKMGFLVSNLAEDAPAPDQAGVQRTWDASPGTIETLPPGVTFQEWDPKHPSQAFAAFVNAIHRSIAAGLNVSYAALSADLSQANYSSARVGLLSERDNWRILQTWLARHFHQRVFAAWLPHALASGQLKVESALAKKYEQGVAWKARGWEWIDPLKDTEAAVLAIQHGLESRTSVLSETGDELEDVFEDLANENALAKQNGLTLSEQPPTPKAIDGGNGNDPGSADVGNGSGGAAQDGGAVPRSAGRPGRSGRPGSGRHDDPALAVI